MNADTGLISGISDRPNQYAENVSTATRSTRVLVVDDDPSMKHMLVNYLEQHDMRVTATSLKQEAIRQFAVDEPSVVLLDLRLGQEDGLDLLRVIRWRSDVHVIIITGHRRDETDRVVGLELGADDYVTKPFGVDELLARIRAALRHRLQQEGEKPLFHSGDLTVDLVRRIVTVRGGPMKLSPREYDILRLLIQHAGKVLTHRMMLKEVWGGEADVQYLRIYIRQLRQKIEPDPERPTHILTETGVGYRLRMLD
jgi:two-component system KDP operon response regulator KdpE